MKIQQVLPCFPALIPFPALFPFSGNNFDFFNFKSEKRLFCDRDRFPRRPDHGGHPIARDHPILPCVAPVSTAKADITSYFLVVSWSGKQTSELV
jgi:hypothetical protein